MIRDEAVSMARINLLHPAIKEKVINAIIEAEKITSKAIRVVQGLRTFKEQQDLFNQPHDGVDNNGNGKIDDASEMVTKAKAGQSYHNFGLAVDICFLDATTSGYKYNESSAWVVDKRVVKVFKNAGFVWGGDFHSITDDPHFEMTFGNNWHELLALHDEKKFISGTEFVVV